MGQIWPDIAFCSTDWNIFVFYYKKDEEGKIMCVDYVQ